MHAAIYRPRELQGYLKTIQMEARKIKALRDQLEAQFARVAKLEFVKYATVVDAVIENNHQHNVQMKTTMHKYLNELRQSRNRAETIKTSLHLQTQNTRVLIKWMLRFDPEKYMFKTKLHRVESLHDYAEKLEQRTTLFISYCDSQIRLVEGAIDAYSATTLRNKPFDEMARYAIIAQNEEAINRLAFSV